MFTFLENLEWRRAEKSFGHLDDEKSLVPLVNQIQNAMIQAPSSFGIQPFHIVRVESKDVKERLHEVSYSQAQVKECHTLFVLCARTDMEDRVDEFLKATNTISPDAIAFYKQCLNHRDVEWASRQAYIALGFGLAACAELKVASCPMEGFDTAGVKEVLGLSSNLTPLVYLTVGKHSEREHPYPRFRFGEKDMVTKK